MRTITVTILAVAALAMAGVACKGASAPPAPPTPDAKATADFKANAMAQAETFVHVTEGPNGIAAAMCKAFGGSACIPPEEEAAVHPALVLAQYAHIIGDTELAARAQLLNTQTQAAWTAAHPPTPAYAPPSYVAPSDPFQQSDINRLKQEVSDLQTCIETGAFC